MINLISLKRKPFKRQLLQAVCVAGTSLLTGLPEQSWATVQAGYLSQTQKPSSKFESWCTAAVWWNSLNHSDWNWGRLSEFRADDWSTEKSDDHSDAWLFLLQRPSPTSKLYYKEHCIRSPVQWILDSRISFYGILLNYSTSSYTGQLTSIYHIKLAHEN